MDCPGQTDGGDGACRLLEEDDVPAGDPFEWGDAVAAEAGLDGLGAIQEAIQVLTGHDGEVGTGMQAGENLRRPAT